MITDKLKNIGIYKGLNSNLDLAIEYILINDISAFAAGRHTIVEDKLYLNVDEYTTKSLTEGKLEKHNNFLDIQIVLKGNELIGYTALDNQEVITEYSAENDVAFYKGTNTLMPLQKGYFMILFPDDLHMPGITDNKPCEIKKLVFKVKIC